MAPSPNAMRVCSRCGTIAPLQSSACKSCSTDFASAVYVEPRPDGVMFAEVLESDFQCRGCGLRSTLDSLYVASEVDCHRCGMTQAFDPSQWEEGLAHAHAVADLSGPPPAGQGSLRHGVPLKGANPFAALGVEYTFAELTKSGMTISSAGVTQLTLRVKVATGHPVCPQGHGPLTIDIGPPGSTRVTCTTCNSPATYELPAQATTLSSACCGVIDEEHRKDRPLVRVQASGNGAAVALTCPGCSASLPATQDSSVITCTFCKAVSYLPKRAFLKLNPTQPSRPFWLLFRGPSAKRGGGAREDAPEMPPSTLPAPVPAPTLPAQQSPVAPRAPDVLAPRSRGPLIALVAVGTFALIAIAVAVFVGGSPKGRGAGHGHHGGTHH